MGQKRQSTLSGTYASHAILGYAPVQAGVNMSTPFLGQVMFAPYTIVVRGFARCDGQILPIAQNVALFSLLGVNYGGDGRSNFALPDLRARSPIGFSGSNDPSWPASGRPIGEQSGVESVTLTLQQLPPHTHTVGASPLTGGSPGPTAASFAQSDSSNVYNAGSSPVALSGLPTTTAGGGQAHSNMQPFLTLSMMISLQGVFPSRQ